MFPSLMASRPDPEAEKHLHNITLPPLCLTLGLLFFFYAFLFGLCHMLLGPCHQSTDYFLKRCKGYLDVLCQNSDEL